MPTIQDLVHRAKRYLKNINEERLLNAYDFAEKAHAKQIRKDGTPYITHPLSAAILLTSLRVDEDTLIACLLHDVPEDTERTIEEIESLFGKEVAFLVEGITKLSKVYYRNDMETRQVESLHKLFIHSARDPRVILIKLADRLHNMFTIEAIPKPAKRIRIAKETLEVFVPVANLLGVWQLKSPLEDLCFKILHPEDFKEISEMVKQSDSRQQGVLKKSIKEVETLMLSKGIKPVSIEGREKSLYSIYRKMLRSGKSFHEIYDLVGIRVILSSVGDCYQVLGILHQSFTPKIGRLKDYIALPKSNGYQAIHTTVFGVDGAITEIQIRSHEMHLEDEYGIAAHYFYRQDQNLNTHIKEKLNKKYEWVQKILNVQKDSSNSKRFMKSLKLDVFEDRIFVFTPKGDVIDLPKGSNVIDFAYHIHSDIGMLAKAAKVNGREKSLFYQLKSSDVVEVVTAESAPGPQLEWLSKVKTNLAKNRVREYMKEKGKAELISGAEELLTETMQLYGLNIQDELTQQRQMAVLDELSYPNWDKVLHEIGQGEIDVEEVICHMYTENDLLGAEISPVNMSAYNKVGLINGGHKDHLHLVGFNVDTIDRVGILSAITSVLAENNINIVEMHSYSHANTDKSNIRVVVEIKDLNEYKKVYYTLKNHKWVLRVTRFHSESPEQRDPTHVHTELDQ